MGELHGDRPLGSGDDDRLGFQPLADRLARVVVEQAASSGLVIGIEGPWGSGKSSLAYLTAKALRKMPEERRPAVVEFQPWLIGDRDALLTSLFGEIATAIDGLKFEAGDATGVSVGKAKSAAEMVRRFASRLGGVGKLVALTKDVVPGAALTGNIIEALAQVAGDTERNRPLAEVKAELGKSLRSLQRRIVVVIDDLDRLEPVEALELLRLVRAVADFPNVVYLLCYDIKVLAGSIKRAARVADGRAFLEKIVQASVVVPQPEAFVLRRWFTRDLTAIASAESDAELQRLQHAIDTEGGRRLTTPRSVVRTLNAVGAFWPSLRGHVDLGDFVWLQLVRTGCPDLYYWIEEYCTEAAAAASGRARVGNESAKRMFARLEEILLRDGSSFEERRWELGERLPGIATMSFRDKKGSEIFTDFDPDAVGAAARDRRLASPDHYRLYFALATPLGAPTQADYDALWSALDRSAAATGDLLLEWHCGRQADGALVTKAETMVERLRSAAPAALNSDRSAVLLEALADVLDATVTRDTILDLGQPALWRSAERLLPVLRDRLDPHRRGITMVRMFKSGASLAWLTMVFRSEIFAHGHYGDRPEPEAGWLLTATEFRAVVRVMLARYRSASADRILAVPKLLNLLFAWVQAGDEEGPRKFVAKQIRSDPGLVNMLEHMAGVVSVNEGFRSTLSSNHVSPFMDRDKARRRIAAIAGKPSSPLVERARRLERAFDEGDRW